MGGVWYRMEKPYHWLGFVNIQTEPDQNNIDYFRRYLQFIRRFFANLFKALTLLPALAT